MLGNHQLLERKLRKSGKTALATVVSCHRTYSMQENVASVGTPKGLCTLDLRVEPDGEPAFEARTDAWLIGTEGAHEGMIVSVLYDPSDHSKVVVDQSEAAWKAADRENMRVRRAARGAATGEDPARTAAIEDMRRAAATDPDGFRKLMQERGPAAFGLPGMPGSPPVVASTSEDPLDRLSKLAELHDRGVLTDAEFETQKKKMLSE